MNRKLLSHSVGPAEHPLIESTIGDLLEGVAAQFPNTEALVSVHQGLRYSYRDFLWQVNRCARALMALGLQKGDRVGIWSPNYAEWTILQFGTCKAGLILVNINPSYRLNELEYALSQSGCSALVIAEQFKTSDYTRMIRDLAPELDHCAPARLRAKRLPALRTLIKLGEEQTAGMYNWSDFMSLDSQVSSAELAGRELELTAHDPINIQYTSGTTGRPKGAALTHHNVVNNAWFIAELMNFTEQDRLVIPVPLYHCFGMVLGNLACVTHGATMILPGDAFEPGAVLQAVQNEKATALHGVPTMFIAELEHTDFDSYDLGSLRTGLMAGSPCPVEVMNAVIERMNLAEMEIAYGMTETSPVSTQTRYDAPIDKRVGTVGQVHPHVEIKIIDPDKGETVPRGETGELCTRGYNVMLGYWNDEQQTREAIDSEGWMHTGDLATMDEEGYVSIVGRIKDMIIRGGENVYPREIEEFLYSHPKVMDVQVIGVPDTRYGEEIMAWILLHENESATEEEMRAYCSGQIAHFKVPRYFKFVSEFPMTVTGKVQKFVMREQSLKELGLERVA
jgi:fatty-acyl-CoA synthase